jgi:hypothetical protein
MEIQQLEKEEKKEKENEETPEKKYIIATIKIPIEIKKNNDYEVLNEHFNIEFEFCDKKDLPKANKTSEVYDRFSQILNGLFLSGGNNNDDNNEIPQQQQQQQQKTTNNLIKYMIKKAEIKPKTSKQPSNNISFKNKKKMSHKYSLKTTNKNDI